MRIWKDMRLFVFLIPVTYMLYSNQLRDILDIN